MVESGGQRPAAATRTPRPVLSAVFLLLALLSSRLALLSSRAALARDDLQLWTEIGVEAPAPSRFRLALRDEVHLSRDAADVGLHGVNLGLGCLWDDRLTATLEFRQEFVRGRDGSLAESRPHASVTWSERWRGFAVSSRNRFEGRLRERRTDVFRYRNRLQVILPLDVAGTGASPFVSEEVFVEGTTETINQNRLASGLALALGAVSGMLYYMLFSTAGSGWTHAHVLGLNLTYSIGGRPMMSSDG
jgi:hypothetical protein